LWKTIKLSADQLLGGSVLFDLGTADQSGYSFYFEAVNGGGGGGNNSTSTQTILWTSDITIPGTDTSGGQGNGNQNQGTGGNSSSTNNTGNSSSSQGNNGNGTSTGNGNGNNASGSGNNNGQSGFLYYNPQIQVTGYGTANGDFWVQHVNQSIEVGWQNLPPAVDSIILSRSQDQSGPWNQLLKENNPSANGSYSLQLVDGTLNQPYYYEMTAYSGTTTIGVYGPAYLPPAGQ
jgi:hypothetical protein